MAVPSETFLCTPKQARLRRTPVTHAVVGDDRAKELRLGRARGHGAQHMEDDPRSALEGEVCNHLAARVHVWRDREWRALEFLRFLKR